ncbi:MAG: hypothetical protein LW698_11915 [Planctomycetaceae bacterium]|nr:hypothetical protein [Planctomycetaceae bacterium]
MAGDRDDIDALVARLQASDAAVRMDAAERLCRAGPAAVAAAVALARACADTDDQVREWSAAALEELGPPPDHPIRGWPAWPARPSTGAAEPRPIPRR